MPLPTLIKTWQIDPNITVTSQGSVYKTKMMMLKAIKDSLVNAALGAWTVVSSSSGRVDTGGNAGTYSTSDNWNSATDFSGVDGLGVPSGARFPWIVLQQTGIAAHYQMLISGEPSTGQIGRIKFSPSVGFTGGAIGTLPTASDSIQSQIAGGNICGGDTTHKIHTWVSTDGQCTRVAVWRGSTNLCCYIQCDVPQDVVSGWTNPSMSLAQGAGSAIATSYAILQAFDNRGYAAATTMGLAWTGEFDRRGTNLMAEVTDIGTIPNDLSGEWPFFGIGLCSKTTGTKGRHGSLFDIWWRPTSVADADTFPNNASTRQFVACGPIILPWVGDTTQMDIV